MAIATVDDIATALAIGIHTNVHKFLTAPKAAGAFQSAWMAPGTGVGVAPPAYTAGSGYTCSAATNGALPYTNGATQNYIAEAFFTATQAGVIILADRLWSCGGMGFGVATYTVTTPGSLPARITDNGLKAEIYIEQFVAAGAASGTLTVNYTDSAAAAQAGVISAVVSAPVKGQMQMVPLANALGVKSIQSCVNSATWTSGTFGVTILQRIAEFPVTLANSSGICMDWSSILQKLPSDVCLMVLFLANGTTAPIIIGSFSTVDK